VAGLAAGCAVVVPAPGRSITSEHVFGRFEGRPAAYKHPRRVIILDALPCTSVGKVEKKALRAMAEWSLRSQSYSGTHAWRMDRRPDGTRAAH
jgi:non-ribosomal peptide synthetase component E (peptide arylation enzyme)